MTKTKLKRIKAVIVLQVPGDEGSSVLVDDQTILESLKIKTSIPGIKFFDIEPLNEDES